MRLTWRVWLFALACGTVNVAASYLLDPASWQTPGQDVYMLVTRGCYGSAVGFVLTMVAEYMREGPGSGRRS